MWSTLPVFTILFGFAMLPPFTGNAVFGQSLNSPDGYLALIGGTIYVNPTDYPIQDGVVLVQGGKIAAVGSRAQVQVLPTAQELDCSGRTIAAGFWNSHVHFFERKWANAETIPAPELARQVQYMLTRYWVYQRVRPGVRVGEHAAASRPHRGGGGAGGRELARRERRWWPRGRFRRINSSTSWAS